MATQELLGGTLESKTISVGMNSNTTQSHAIRRTYTITLEKGEDGYYIVKCVELEGVITQGKTVREAIENGIEAIELMLEELGYDKEYNIIIIHK